MRSLSKEKSQKRKELLMAEEQQQQRINQAAEQLADAIRDSYQVVAERGTSAQ
jgi:hypothetical protein